MNRLVAIGVLGLSVFGAPSSRCVTSSCGVGRVALGQEVVPVARALVASDGRRLDAKMKGADWPAKLQFDVGGVEQSWEVSNVVRWGAPREAVRGYGVVLGGASLVIVDQWELDETRFSVPLGAASVATELSLPRTSVCGVLLKWPADAAQRDRRWRQIAESRGTQDLVLLENGDVLAGTIERTVRVPRGRADDGNATDGQAVGGDVIGGAVIRGRTAGETAQVAGDNEPALAIAIKTPAGALKVSFDQAEAIVFRGGPAISEPRRGPHCLVGLADGSLLDVKAAGRDGDRYAVTLTDDTVFESDPEWLWGDAVFVQPLDTGVVYLSDLTELGYKHVPFLEREWSFARDRNVLGLRLRLDATPWFKGLGMHSTSRLAYNLNNEYATFQAELAIDDAADRRGSVVFRVYVDRGEGAWQNAYESPIVRRGDTARTIHVDVRGALRMALIADAADWGDVGDHADWLDARLVRPSVASGR